MAENKLNAEKKVQSKPARKVADKETFSHDYLVRLEDSSKVSNDDVEVNKKDVVIKAFSRGLRPVGEVELTDKKIVDERNVLLTYTVEVEKN